jgi:hypothetical protein
MSDTLFKREWKVQVDNLDVSNLHLEFKILRTLKKEPNKASLVLLNLSRDHIAQLQKRNNPNPGKKLVGVPVQIEAGYEGNTSVLFSADLREVGSVKEDTNWKTTIAGDDGGRAYREGRINTQFTKGTAIADILRQCCNSMGIGLGNSSSFTANAQIAGIGSTLPHTLTASGNAADVLDRVIKSIGLTWSIQAGALQLLKKGTPLDQEAIKITPRTGLIGSPQASIDSTVSLGNPQQFAPGAKQKVAKQPVPKDPGIIKIKTLLIPGMVPGRKITLESEFYNGGYMITEVVYSGQSFGQDWYCDCVARLYT